MGRGATSAGRRLPRWATDPTAPGRAAHPCPPRERSHSGRIVLRTRRDRRPPPLADTAADDSVDAARRLPPPRDRRSRTGPRRRRRSSGGFGPATPTERPTYRSPSLGCRGPAAQHGLRRPWSVTDSTCRPAPGRRRPGEPVRMLPRNQSPELAIALGGRSRKAHDGRGPRRRLPPAGPCSPRAVAVVRA